jgi:hypothetical protein
MAVYTDKSEASYKLNVGVGAHLPIHLRLIAVCLQPERTLLLEGLLLLSALSVVMTFVLNQYFGIHALSSLIYDPRDCYLSNIPGIGGHCFSDYARAISEGTQTNPWATPSLYPDDKNVYTAAGTLTPLIFAGVGVCLHAPTLGLAAYLVVLTVSVLSPALWAARGARGLERVMVFITLGVLAIPVWTVVDRANTVGFAVPIFLVLLIALRRQRWALVAAMVVLAALIKPQFVVLVIVLFAARQWRWGAITLGGIAISNVSAYLLWPQDFPATIWQSIHNAVEMDSALTASERLAANVSFANGLFLPDNTVARSTIGYVILVVLGICLLMLGRRIPPVMAAISLLAAASLFPALSAKYYLVFALPIAALVVRDPEGPPGSGIFDRLRNHRRGTVTMCVTAASAISIAQVAVPGIHQPTDGTLAWTTSQLAPSFWLLACIVIVVSYARRVSDSAEVAMSTHNPVEWARQPEPALPRRGLALTDFSATAPPL